MGDITTFYFLKTCALTWLTEHLDNLKQEKSINVHVVETYFILMGISLL
jgi:hypothetical protein